MANENMIKPHPVPVDGLYNGQAPSTFPTAKVDGPDEATYDEVTLSSAQITGGQSPSEAEHNALQADMSAVNTALAALSADVASIHDQLDSLLSALQTSNLMSSS